MTEQERDAMLQKVLLEEKRKGRCICLNFAEAEEVYNALMLAHTQCQKACARCEKTGLTSLSEKMNQRIEFMDKLTTRLEKKLKW